MKDATTRGLSIHALRQPMTAPEDDEYEDDDEYAGDEADVDGEDDSFDGEPRRRSIHEAFGNYGFSILGSGDLDGHEAEIPRRGAGKFYGGDGTTEIRMCQTEVALRLGRHLAESPLLKGDIYLQLGGAELTRRRDDTVFRVAKYLSRWGYSRDRARAEARPAWIGFYSHKRHPRKLLLNFDRFDGHIMAFLATGQRLIVHCSGGNVKATRSPAEVHDLNRALGRAVGWHGTKPDDVIAVCTPRSDRFRKLTAEKSRTIGIQRAGVRFFHVDRGGGVMGLGENLSGG